MRKLIILLGLMSFNVFAESVDINKASAKEIAASLNGVGEKSTKDCFIPRKSRPF